MPLVKDLPPDKRYARPEKREDYIRLIEITFRDKGNQYNDAEQRYMAGEAGVNLSDWRKAPLAGLKRILAYLESYSMILFED